jgi:hypothetical protein
MGNNLPFGGKVVIVCDDFRQTLLIVKLASKIAILEACVAVVFKSATGEPPFNRDFCIHPRDGSRVQIGLISPNLTAMMYPLLFPYGEPGWSPGLEHQFGQGNVSAKQFYTYRLCIREDFNVCLNAGPLSQQFIVDMYIIVEALRLKYIRESGKITCRAVHRFNGSSAKKSGEIGSTRRKNDHFTFFFHR